jgi:hypothetical protein
MRVKLTGGPDQKEFNRKAFGGKFNFTSEDGKNYTVTTTYLMFGSSNDPGAITFDGTIDDDTWVYGSWHMDKEEGQLAIDR